MAAEDLLRGSIRQKASSIGTLCAGPSITHSSPRPGYACLPLTKSCDSAASNTMLRFHLPAAPEHRLRGSPDACDEGTRLLRVSADQPPRGLRDRSPRLPLPRCTI